MDKRKKWQKWLIIAVLLLTAYNILPTIFYYSKPLKSPIDTKRATEIAENITGRINALEEEAVNWVSSFCHLLRIKPKSIRLSKENPQWIEIDFQNNTDTKKFCHYMPRAGSLIPFLPAQLYLPKQDLETTKITILRQIPLHLDESKQYFSFSQKIHNGEVTPLYTQITKERAQGILAVLERMKGSQEILPTERVSSLDRIIATYSQIVDLFGEESKTAKRFLAYVGLPSSYDYWNNLLIEYKDDCKRKIAELKSKNTYTPSQLSFLEGKERQLFSFLSAIKQAKKLSIPERNPLDVELGINGTKEDKISLEDSHPLIKELVVDWNNDLISFVMHEEIANFSSSSPDKNNILQQMILAELAEVSKQTKEVISQDHANNYQIALTQLEGCTGFLALDLKKIAKDETQQLAKTLTSYWNPSHPDLSSDNFPIYDYETYLSLPKKDQAFCLVLYAPSLHGNDYISNAKNGSIYLIPKGLQHIAEKYEEHSRSPSATLFLQDFLKLKEILHQSGFTGYISKVDGSNSHLVFEQPNFWEMLLLASREKFSVRGHDKFALLELSNVEQRILTENQIDTAIHEDLLKAKDEYVQSCAALTDQQRYTAPEPNKSPFWNNLLLSARKYFRGDERKILKWGLDLSGGKTVMVELRDQKQVLVDKDEDITQAINELYARVNKMGLSEVTIRQEGNKIALDFPGSQNLSAEELIKASTMYFHLVNEKFTPSNSDLGIYVNQFLQDIWNEAVVRNEKEIEAIHKIALRHLYGESLQVENPQPKSEAAKILYENGLRLATPEDVPSTAFNDSLSKVAIFREEQSQGLPHPLLFVFHNYALDGASLQNIHASYDTSKGNYLSFEVKPQMQVRNEKIKPRESFHQWTSTYCKEKISSTPNDFLHGKGWRMAVILNGSVISAPTLDSALRDSAMITGGFSQREVNLLVSDLKAGSLSFTPKILSEKNISPELGQKDRMQGIIATCIALLLVIAAMVGYYRFAGAVASVAVVLNLIIMWAILQNLDATLTLAGIAAIILTLGMAVDANVLVFERVKEEFASSGRIGVALQTGYKKAFSAIFDSNLTTILAALILLNFDSGPIKAFAITLIIGIATSMFTALFLTRFFFLGWIENPKNQSLTMSNWIKPLGINFLKYWKVAFALTAIIIGVGSYSVIKQKDSIFGMDFTGGYTLQLEVEPTQGKSYRETIEQALFKHGISYQEMEVRELSPANHIRLRLGAGLEKEGRPFYGMIQTNSQKKAKYSYQNNPRLNWIVQALESEGIDIPQNSLEQLDRNWSAMSGQLSKSMRNQALIGLGLALLAIFIYINFRFEFTFAISAIICVFHDVFITLATMGILYSFGLPLQIDLHAITAVMTIIGYSLNDTIIIFDRIREEMKWSSKKSLSQIVNSSLNATLSRTTITSGTTLLVLIALVGIGGGNIFNFSMVMTIGVIFGTLSSLFIASPIVMFMHARESRISKEKSISTNIS